MKKWAFVLGLILLPTLVWAGFQGYGGTTSLGVFNRVRCSTGMSCTNVNGTFTMVASAAAGDISGGEGVDAELTLNADEGDDNGDSWLIEALASGNSLSFKNDTSGSQVEKLAISTAGVLSLSDGETISNAVADDTVRLASNDAAMILEVYSPLTSDGDASIKLIADASADNGDEWLIQHDGTTNDLVFQNDTSGSLVSKLTLAETGDMILAGTTPYFTVGDAGAEDAGLVFDGNAQDFNISLDDTSDDLVIGLGSAAGTTDAIRIDENQDVTFVQNVLGLGTDSLSGFLQKQVASTTASITAAQCGSTFVSDSADVMALPEASTVLGCRLTFICGTADDFDVNPDDADAIGITGALSPSAGDAIRCTDAGAGFVLEAVGAALWAVISTNGTITDVN